ncbi:MAG: hypothetical protein HWE35_14940 [Rhodobacteraceae bacterium]|nr:hypothetical protein [Paracoccaceae bacterium]
MAKHDTRALITGRSVLLGCVGGYLGVVAFGMHWTGMGLLKSMAEGLALLPFLLFFAVFWLIAVFWLMAIAIDIAAFLVMIAVWMVKGAAAAEHWGKQVETIEKSIAEFIVRLFAGRNGVASD